MHLSHRVMECGKDTKKKKKKKKKIYKIANRILGTNKEKPMPTMDDKNKLADDFADYFIDKIQKIRGPTGPI